MKHDFMAIYDDVILRPLEVQDIEYLRLWRNDTNNTRYLRNIGTITPEMQLKWYNNYLEDKNEIIFAIEETKTLKRMVGSVALYNFNEEQAEIGKIMIGDDEAHGKGIGRKAFVMAMRVGIDKKSIKKYVASVHRENIRAYTNYLKIGFYVVGNHPFENDGYEDEIEVTESRLKNFNEYLYDIIIK